MVMDMHKNLYFGLLLLALSLFLPVASMAADATNPAGTTIHGDWSGTATNDNYTNHGTVTNDIDMSQGGTDEVLNTGTVGNNILMSNQDGNSVVNSGSVNDIVMGSGNYNNISNEAGGTANFVFGVLNADPSDTGGQSIVTNHGTAHTLYGSYNQGVGSTGSHNTVNNFGTATDLFGTANANDNSTGGENTIENTGTVTGGIHGTGNWADGSSGGNNSIDNSGTVNGSIIGTGNAGPNSSGGGNTITNSGDVGSWIVGTDNVAVDTSGGGNQITNSGTVESGIIGTYNQNARTSGGSNEITNTGAVNGYIYGSYNAGSPSISGYSRGGSNTIRNSGTVDQSIYGSYNEGAGTSGGSNTIRNSGSVQDIVGSSNLANGSNGGSNTIRNSGTVRGSIHGSYNQGENSSGGSNTIINYGAVSESIFGSYNEGQGASGGGNTIYLKPSSTVGGDVIGTFGGTKTGTDTLNMFGGAVVGRNVGLFDIFNKRGPGRAVVRGNLNLGGADVNVVMHEFETQVQVDGQVTGATGNLTVDVLGGSEQFEHGKTVDVFSVGEIDTWNSETINESFAEWDLVLLNGQITALFLGQGGGTTANQPSGQVTSKDTMARQFNTYRKLLDRRIAKLLAPRPPRDASGSQELSYNLPSKGAATGLAAGEAAVASDTRRWGVWVNGALSWQSNNSDRARFHGTTYTTLAGVDYTITDRIVAGLAIGNDQSWLNTSFNDGSMTTSGFVAAPYVAFSLLDNLILDVTGAVGLAYNRQERNKSTFDFDSDYESVRTMIGSGITYYHLWNNWSFDVGAGFMYANEYAPSYTERGDPNLRNRVRSSDVYVGEFNVTGGVKYYFEYFAPYATVTYLVSPWMTRPDYSNDRDEIEVALGLDIEPMESFTLSLQVSKSFLRRHVDTTNVMAALRYQF